MSDKIDLSLVLACYSDGKYLEESVKEICQALDMTKINYEIIFVYDCGTGDTLEAINRTIAKYNSLKRIKKIVHEKNEGRGKSVRDGMKIAEGNIVGYVDVDLDVHPRYIPSMVRAIINDGYDVATAFRYYKLQISPFPILRHALSHGYRFISRFLLDERLKDSESGYKFFKREKVMPLVDISRYNKWFWDTEIMTYCLYGGLKVKEISCVFERRNDKISSVRTLTTVFTHLISLIKFKRYLIKNKKALVKQLQREV